MRGLVSMILSDERQDIAEYAVMLAVILVLVMAPFGSLDRMPITRFLRWLVRSIRPHLKPDDVFGSAPVLRGPSRLLSPFCFGMWRVAQVARRSHNASSFWVQSGKIVH